MKRVAPRRLQHAKVAQQLQQKGFLFLFYFSRAFATPLFGTLPPTTSWSRPPTGLGPGERERAASLRGWRSRNRRCATARQAPEDERANSHRHNHHLTASIKKCWSSTFPVDSIGTPKQY